MEALKMQFSSIVIFLCRVCSSDFRCADTSSCIGRVDKLHAGANCYSCGRSALSDSAGTSTVPMMYHPPNTIMWNGKPARCLSPSTDFWPPCQDPLGPAGGRQCLVLYKQFRTRQNYFAWWPRFRSTTNLECLWKKNDRDIPFVRLLWNKSYYMPTPQT